MLGTGRFQPVPNPINQLLPVRCRAGAGVSSNHQNDLDFCPQTTQVLTGSFGGQFERIAAERRNRNCVVYIIDDPAEFKGAGGQPIEPASWNRHGEGINP